MDKKWESIVKKILLFDWGDTLMRDFKNEKGKMYLWGKIEAMPNAVNALKELHLLVDCYLATNAKDSNKGEIIKALNMVGLDDYIKDVFCYQEIGYEKPSNQYFQTIIKKLDTSANNIIMVGDNLKSDIEGAHNSGIKGVLFASKDKYPHYSGKRIDNLLLLKNYI